jgi:hypothetical protein
LLSLAQFAFVDASARWAIELHLSARFQSIKLVMVSQQSLWKLTLGYSDNQMGRAKVKPAILTVGKLAAARRALAGKN